MNNNYKRAFGAMAARPVPKSSEEQALEQEMLRLQPRKAITSDAPVSDPILFNQMNEKIDAADRARQLQELQDLEDVGAFEEPTSEVNQRAARLRKLISGK
jgi:hypothetical protein